MNGPHLSLSSPALNAPTNVDMQQPQPLSQPVISNQDQARGFVAALDLRYKGQFSGALGDLAAKVSNGSLDDDSFLMLTRAMVDASQNALSR
ncbi:hypothetical protein [Pseudomonas yamanorum]|uniref:Uncharacterized protein n=1 Tax=Pseudomonas yamanorum TaxID=515393 RepID=A0A7Y8F848_9PSED|nr:hypothetical protein [Pseudomonas yamanorum]NWE74024.1 hypothetical protein [Pseudomonas yamanorum]